MKSKTKPKICAKCFKEIGNEDYWQTLLFISNKKVHEGFMHKSCNDNMNTQNEKTLKMLNKFAGGLFPMFGSKSKEVVEIK